MTQTQQKTVLEYIYDWSLQRSAWQRDALRRIISNGKFADKDILELTTLCKKEMAGKLTEQGYAPLEKKHIPASPGASDSVALITIGGVEGVNSLAKDQTLSFEPNGITIIYGDNGAGKSGYGRILKRACRARHPGEITPNIYIEETPGTPSASLTYSIGGVVQAPDSWTDADGLHHILSAISVFDSECASVHIDGKNEVAFRPFGLDVPDELASACQKIKDVLLEEKKQLEKTRDVVFLKPFWKDTTIVGKALATLKHTTDSGIIRNLATLSEEEQARIIRLKEDLSKDLVKAAAEQKLKADNIKRLLAVITGIDAETSNEKLIRVIDLQREAKSKKQAAQIAAEKAFSKDKFLGVGEEVWRLLWEAARRYSTEVAYPEKTFPPSKGEDVKCVLCQQPLANDALERMARFEEFIKIDIEKQSQEAIDLYKVANKSLVSLSMDIRPLKPIRQGLAIQNKVLARKVIRFIASARLRRYALIKALKTGEELFLPNAAPNPSIELTQLEAGTSSYALELQKSALLDERKKLTMEFAELTDRALLNDNLSIVLGEIERLKAIEFITKCISDTSTNAITRLGNEIADTAITPKLRDRFQEEIVRLAAEKVRVEIVRSGGKFGNPYYKIQLFSNPSATVGEILSEGEQTCVALAAFFTELATATHRSALVFDDPVTSLDHRWRAKVAERFIAEAAERQIIVFTHDLILVNDLFDLAIEAQLNKKLVTISRGRQGTGVVGEGLPWIVKSVEDRIDKLEKDARSARAYYDNRQDDDYAHAAVSIYDKLRASWERALEDIVFCKIVQRHRDYINAKHLKKVTILTDDDCNVYEGGFKRCCNIVDAHDPSRGRNAAAPPPDDVLKDIQTLRDWVVTLRQRQKAVV